MTDFEEKAKKMLEEKDKVFSTNNEENNNEVKINSLGKANSFADNELEEGSIMPGYVEIYAKNFPSKGLFYSDDMRFYIKSASVKEIKHFSMIDEADPFSVDEALTYILSNCLAIRRPGKMISYKDLCEEDRINIILNIRDLTFVKGENKLAITVKCSECKFENEIIIKNDSFEHNTIGERTMQYYDNINKQFIFKTKSSGDIILKAPTVGIMSQVSKYIKNSRQSGKDIDKAFLKVLPYTVQDWRNLTEKKIDDLYIEFLRWDSTKYQLFYNLVDSIRVSVKENLVKSCDKCGMEVSAPVSFPGGIKSLFVISNIFDELI